MTYTEYKHRHNFFVWAAARAAQRGFTNVEMLKKALEQCGIKAFTEVPSQTEPFDRFHITWCSSICDYLNEKGIQNVTYGRAAKLVNVYLKGMVVIPNLNSELASIIHPPIDRVLLRNIARCSEINPVIKLELLNINWTQLNQQQYFELIERLRSINGDRPFWSIERYWTVTNE